MLDPLPRRYHRVLAPVSSTVSSAFPNRVWVGFPRLSCERLLAGQFFEDADIPLCSGLQVCSPPRSFLPLRVLPQGSWDFYVRAERASLPPHAPDILTVRMQAIDGTGTCTLLVSRPCRLLLSVGNAHRRIVDPRGTYSLLALGQLQ